MIRYGYSVLPYGDEPLEVSFDRVARCGYDSIELLGRPEAFDVDEITRLRERTGLQVGSLCMVYEPATDIVSADPRIRRHARDYVLRMLELAAQVGVEIVPITPTACMKTRPEAPLKHEWEWARETIRAAGDAAQGHGIRVVIEPWNRYETYLVNRLDQAVQMAREVDHPNVGVKGDLFHMNIEELDIPDAIRATGSLLWHLDVADSTRAAPGVGHTDLAAVMAALGDIGFDGILNFELLPAAADPFLSIKDGGATEFRDTYTAAAIGRLKAIAGQVLVAPAREN
jgi:sugar phosphate isomerase/epimerase